MSSLPLLVLIVFGVGFLAGLVAAWTFDALDARKDFRG